MPSLPKSLTNVLLGSAFWLAFVGLGWYWVSSTQEEHLEKPIPSAYVEPPGVQQARANLVRFLHSAQRQDLILVAVPWGGRRPTDLNIYLCRDWKKQSSATRARLLHEWKTSWANSATEGLHHNTKPKLWFIVTNRSKDEELE